jgi:catalase
MIFPVRTNDYKQAGERSRTMPDWERDDLVNNLVSALKVCNPDIQERMIGHLTRCDEDYGQRVAAGLGRSVEETADTAASK